MHTIIAGSRDIFDYSLLIRAITDSHFNITRIISGAAPGVDTLAIQYALAQNVPLTTYPAEWTKHGRSAGHIRNRQMAEVSDALIAIWDGKSPGTSSMIAIARELKLTTFVFRTDPPDSSSV